MAFKHAVLSMLKHPVTLPTIVKMTLSVAIIVSASTVMVTINRSQRETQTLHLYYIANIMITNIVAAGFRIATATATVIKVVYPDIDIFRCNGLVLGMIPVVANSVMVVVLCLDRIFTVMAPNTYKDIMLKPFGFGIVYVIWHFSCLGIHIGLMIAGRDIMTDGMCDTGYIEQFKIKIIVFPMLLSGALAAIHNIFIFHKVYITTTLDGRPHIFARFCKASKVYKETQPISVTLLILGVYNIAAGIILIIIGLVQQHGGGPEEDSLLSLCGYITSITMLIQSLLYVKFLHTIKERLRFGCRR